MSFILQIMNSSHCEMTKKWKDDALLYFFLKIVIIEIPEEDEPDASAGFQISEDIVEEDISSR